MARKKVEVTNPEHEKLIEVLKFTPCTYKIQLWGYGGEKVMGVVDREVWDYCMDNQVDLSEIAWGDEDSVEGMGLDIDKLPFPPGSWYECDGLTHVNGASRVASTIQIDDENGNTVFQRSLEDCDGLGDSPELGFEDEVFIGQRSPGEVVFVGQSNEKGTFFEGEIELKSPFDSSKLSLTIEEVDGEEIVTGVQYDGEEIDNWGGNTDGKSSNFDMYLVLENKEFERYEPGEKDWGHPESGPSPSDWERSPKFDFEKVKPTIPGWYTATWGSWGTAYGSIYWNGTNFGEWEHGIFKPVNNVQSWSGYNWDTSDWANQPAEPVDVKCNHKKCGWVGMRSDMTEDDDHNDICPNCGNVDWEWIDYDPNTKEGRKNREKYIKQGETV
jgi:hypothetical protein